MFPTGATDMLTARVQQVWAPSAEYPDALPDSDPSFVLDPSRFQITDPAFYESMLQYGGILINGGLHIPSLLADPFAKIDEIRDEWPDDPMADPLEFVDWLFNELGETEELLRLQMFVPSLSEVLSFNFDDIDGTSDIVAFAGNASRDTVEEILSAAFFDGAFDGKILGMELANWRVRADANGVRFIGGVPWLADLRVEFELRANRQVTRTLEVVDGAGSQLNDLDGFDFDSTTIDPVTLAVPFPAIGAEVSLDSERTGDRPGLKEILAHLGIDVDATVFSIPASGSAAFRAYTPGFDVSADQTGQPLDPLKTFGGVQIEAELGIQGLVDSTGFSFALSPPSGSGVVPDFAATAWVDNLILGGVTIHNADLAIVKDGDALRLEVSGEANIFGKQVTVYGLLDTEDLTGRLELTFGDGEAPGPDVGDFDFQGSFNLVVFRDGQDRLQSQIEFQGTLLLPAWMAELAPDQPTQGGRPAATATASMSTLGEMDVQISLERFVLPGPIAIVGTDYPDGPDNDGTFRLRRYMNVNQFITQLQVDGMILLGQDSGIPLLAISGYFTDYGFGNLAVSFGDAQAGQGLNLGGFVVAGGASVTYDARTSPRTFEMQVDGLLSVPNPFSSTPLLDRVRVAGAMDEHGIERLGVSANQMNLGSLSITEAAIALERTAGGPDPAYELTVAGRSSNPPFWSDVTINGGFNSLGFGYLTLGAETMNLAWVRLTQATFGITVDAVGLTMNATGKLAIFGQLFTVSQATFTVPAMTGEVTVEVGPDQPLNGLGRFELEGTLRVAADRQVIDLGTSPVTGERMTSFGPMTLAVDFDGQLVLPDWLSYFAGEDPNSRPGVHALGGLSSSGGFNLKVELQNFAFGPGRAVKIHGSHPAEPASFYLRRSSTSGATRLRIDGVLNLGPGAGMDVMGVHGYLSSTGAGSLAVSFNSNVLRLASGLNSGWFTATASARLSFDFSNILDPEFNLTVTGSMDIGPSANPIINDATVTGRITETGVQYLELGVSSVSLVPIAFHAQGLTVRVQRLGQAHQYELYMAGQLSMPNLFDQVGFQAHLDTRGYGSFGLNATNLTLVPGLVVLRDGQFSIVHNTSGLRLDIHADLDMARIGGVADLEVDGDLTVPRLAPSHYIFGREDRGMSGSLTVTLAQGSGAFTIGAFSVSGPFRLAFGSGVISFAVDNGTLSLPGIATLIRVNGSLRSDGTGTLTVNANQVSSTDPTDRLRLIRANSPFQLLGEFTLIRARQGLFIVTRFQAANATFRWGGLVDLNVDLLSIASNGDIDVQMNGSRIDFLNGGILDQRMYLLVGQFHLKVRPAQGIFDLMLRDPELNVPFIAAGTGRRIDMPDVTVNMNLGGNFSFNLLSLQNLNLLDFTDNGADDGLVRINGTLNLQRTNGVVTLRVTGAPQLTYSTLVAVVSTAATISPPDDDGMTQAAATLATTKAIILQPVETAFGGGFELAGQVQMASLTAEFAFTNFLRADTTEVDETKPFMYIAGMLETQVDAFSISSNGAMDIDVDVPQFGPDSLHIADASLEAKTVRTGSGGASFYFNVNAGNLHLFGGDPINLPIMSFNSGHLASHNNGFACRLLNRTLRLPNLFSVTTGTWDLSYGAGVMSLALATGTPGISVFGSSVTLQEFYTDSTAAFSAEIRGALTLGGRTLVSATYGLSFTNGWLTTTGSADYRLGSFTVGLTGWAEKSETEFNYSFTGSASATARTPLTGIRVGSGTVSVTISSGGYSARFSGEILGVGVNANVDSSGQIHVSIGGYDLFKIG